MPKNPIYFDYAATTPVDKRVLRKMMGCVTIDGIFGNPASRSHSFGWDAERAVKNAQSQVATTIGAKPHEIIWTSGSTEANNLAIKGVASFYKNEGVHIVTVATEHKAVLDAVSAMEKNGCTATYLNPSSSGLVSVKAVEAALTSKTRLVSVMWVNNEIGVVQPIAEIGRLCHEHGILLHVDATQAAGKIAMDVDSAHVDLLSLSAHKVYGPKGIGVLYVSRRARARLSPQMHGGGHQLGLRSGTIPTHQVVGMGEALKFAEKKRRTEYERTTKLRDSLLAGLSKVEGVHVNGELASSVPHILNLSFSRVDSESLIVAIEGVAVSSGSACTSESIEPSHVLQALKISDEIANSSIRISFGRFTTEKEVSTLASLLCKKVPELRKLDPE